MHPSPLLPDFPSSPSSAWSCTGSPSPSSSPHGHLFPPTPDPFFSSPHTLVSPDDEFTFRIDVQCDKMVSGSPHSSCIQIPSPKTDPRLLSADDASKLQVFMRNSGHRENMYRRLESSPSLGPHNTLPFPPARQDSANKDISWGATRSSPVDPDDLPDPSRYSVLIHEVSLLVGLAADDDDPSPGDGYPLVPDGSKHAPLTMTPTKSLASRKHQNASRSRPTNANVQIPSSNISIPSTINHANPRLHDEKPPPVGSRDFVIPIARNRSSNVVCPSLSPRRRQGQVFHFDPSPSIASYRSAVDLDETFIHPREAPPKPTPNPLANRCSSLDRLEYSLRKLEAHAPGNHCKSQSEGRSLDHVAQRKDKRPSLPPPRRLKKQQQTHEIVRHNPSRLYHFSGLPPPVSGPLPLHHHVVPRTCPAISLDDEHHEGNLTPGSFMDMDIPLTQEGSQKRQASFPLATSKEKMKSLVSVAKRVSRGVIAWGKTLTASTKSSVTGQGTTTV